MTRHGLESLRNHGIFAVLLAAIGCSGPVDKNGDGGNNVPVADADTPDTGNGTDMPEGAECAENVDCEDSVCDPVTNRCVECTTNEHCTGGTTCVNRVCSEASLRVEPDRLVFGPDLALGESQTLPLDLTNEGASAITPTLRLLGDEEDGAVEYRFESEVSGLVIQAGATETIDVTYEPVNMSQDVGAIEITFGEQGMLTVELLGPAEF
jgi:hypothetical protein